MDKKTAGTVIYDMLEQSGRLNVVEEDVIDPLTGRREIDEETGAPKKDRRLERDVQGLNRAFLEEMERRGVPRDCIEEFGFGTFGEGKTDALVDVWEIVGAKNDGLRKDPKAPRQPVGPRVGR